MFGAGVVLLLLAAGFGGMMYVLVKPSKGPRIPGYSSPRTALLVVDIQEDFTGSDAKVPYKDGPRILSAANELLARAQREDCAVVFIRNEVDNACLRFLVGGRNAPGAPGTAMDRRLVQVPGTLTLPKYRSDAFTNSELDAFLRQRRVDRLVIVGLDGAYCIDATTKGALNRGYKVTLVTRGIATESGQSLEDLGERWRKLGVEVVEFPGARM